MSVSILSLLEYLRSFARTEGEAAPGLRFDEVRFFSAEEACARPETLYVCSGEELARLQTMPETDGSARRTLLLPLPEEDGAPAAVPGLVVVRTALSPERFFNRVQDFFAQNARWERELDRAIYVDKTFQSLLKTGCDFLGQPLLVWDTNFNILAHAASEPVRSAALRQMIEQRFFPEEVVLALVQNGRGPVRDSDGSLRILTPEETHCELHFHVRHYFRGQRRTYSAALLSERELSPGDTQFLLTFFEKLEELLRVAYPDGGSDSLSEGFLRSLVSGQLRDPEQILERAAAFGLSTNDKYLLYRIYFKDFTLRRAQFFIDSLRVGLPSEPIIVHDDHVVMLKSLSLRFCRALESQLRFHNLLQNYDAVCGLSREITDLAAFPAAFEQAGAAARYGRLCRRADSALTERIFYYGMAATFHMLDCYRDRTGELMSLLPAGIARLLRAAEEGEAELELLSVYMTNGRSTAATAQKQGLHRNTVIYRLNRIKEHYALDLEDHNTVFSLLLMLKIHEYLQLTQDGE